jgi:pyrroline-5-carboxylate reductase
LFNIDDLYTKTRQILGAFGLEVFVDDESALDMATALSGSGPAYFFLVAEAMIDTGVHMGFSRAVATVRTLSFLFLYLPIVYFC